MSDFENRIKKAADDFARSVLDTLRGLTLTELAKVIQVTGAAVVRRVRPQRAPAAVPVPAKATPRTKPAARRAAAKPAAAKPKTRRPLSPKQAAARRVQGQYLDLLRKFSDAQKKQFKAIAQQDGVGAALSAIKSALGRK